MRKPKRQINFLTRDEIKEIIDTCDKSLIGKRDRALLETLFSTGMRIAEALAIERRIFDEKPATREMTIIGKGGYQRVIYFSNDALKSILSYLKERVDSKTPLFPITSRQAQRMVKWRADYAGIRKYVSPHVFRHSLATDLLRQGVDIRIVSAFLGHRSISNTMIYTHVVSPQLKKIHEELYK